MEQDMHFSHDSGTNYGESGTTFLWVTAYLYLINLVVSWITWAGMAKAIPLVTQSCVAASAIMAAIYHTIASWNIIKGKIKRKKK